MTVFQCMLIILSLVHHYDNIIMPYLSKIMLVITDSSRQYIMNSN